MRVSILGMGRMGLAVAGRLVESNHDVAVWNRTPGKAEDVVAAGATESKDIAAAVGSADVVITTLATDDAVREVALGRAGIHQHLGDRLYIESSTISPALSGELAQRFTGFLAMPIAGSPDAVRTGNAAYLVGGPDEVAGRAKPVIDALSSIQHRYPSAPLASVAKLTANSLLLAAIVGLAESIAAGRAGGLDDAQLTELLESSPMLGPGVKNRLDAMMSGDSESWWTIALGLKDVKLVLDLVTGTDEQLPAMLAIRERYEAAIDRGLADDDIAAISRLYRHP
ncbi:MAG TPA: NAD(P)-dependent oxidoreductase [Mycobacteriales bacterium]|nr:NAD(P)-dependent oxidoreductase [Mycobacteriales bacterium]